MGDPLIISVAGIVINTCVDLNNDRLGLGDVYQNFLVENEDPNITLELTISDLPDITSWKCLFDSGGTWRLWRGVDQYALSFHIPDHLSNYRQIAIYNQDFSMGTVYIGNDAGLEGFIPLCNILLETLMVNYLSINRKGIMLHACAVKDAGTGRLFCGSSGDGKSTISRLWSLRENTTVLSDDRVILREQEGRFSLHGTPWHGEAGFNSSESIPLDQMFILQHAIQNQVSLLKPFDATARLLARSFPTFWNAQGMDFTIDFLTKLTQAAPCYELGFRPDAEIVDFVRCLN
jgi:hypothetical protein